VVVAANPVVVVAANLAVVVVNPAVVVVNLAMVVVNLAVVELKRVCVVKQHIKHTRVSTNVNLAATHANHVKVVNVNLVQNIADARLCVAKHTDVLTKNHTAVVEDR
jgi:hypothetical protein